jgi:hypothetical protein
MSQSTLTPVKRWSSYVKKVKKAPWAVCMFTFFFLTRVEFTGGSANYFLNAESQWILFYQDQSSRCNNSKSRCGGPSWPCSSSPSPAMAASLLQDGARHTPSRRPMALPSSLCPPLPPAAPSRLAREVCELEPTQQWSSRLVKRAAPV